MLVTLCLRRRKGDSRLSGANTRRVFWSKAPDICKPNVYWVSRGQRPRRCPVGFKRSQVWPETLLGRKSRKKKASGGWVSALVTVIPAGSLWFRAGRPGKTGIAKSCRLQESCTSYTSLSLSHPPHPFKNFQTNTPIFIFSYASSSTPYPCPRLSRW